MVNHATMNGTVKITETIFIWHVYCIYRQRQIKKYTFGQKDASYVRFIIKKLDIYTRSPSIMQLNFITAHHINEVSIVHSTGTVQPQAHPMML